MILKPNPLNLFGLRKTEIAPVYFEYVTVDFSYNLDAAISQWIEKNLKGRYFVGRSSGVDSSNKINQVLKVGFEEPKELSMFMLACPHLKYK
jgi:hypothetical protein